MNEIAGAPLAYTNPQIQRLRRLLGRRSARRDEGAFVVEGPLLVAAALASGWPVEAQYVAPGVSGLPGSRVVPLARGVAERVAATDTPTGLFAVVRSRPPSAELLATASWAVVLDRVADPGNLGTVLRSAEAAGVDVVVLTPGTVDAFNPKTVRASAGAVLSVPIVTATLDEAAAAGLRLVGTSSHRGRAHGDVDWTGRVAVVAGSESRGLDELGPEGEWARIEHRGRAESLNVAMAVTVICFEALRQRGGAGAQRAPRSGDLQQSSKPTGG